MSLPLRRISGPRGFLRPYILYSLSKKPMSGYELISDLDVLTGGAWHPGSGSIYPILESLRRKGLIEVASKGRRSKRAYGLTPKGEETLEDDRKMISQFVPKWNRIRLAVSELLSAELASTILLDMTRSNRVIWERVLESGELPETEARLRLKEYRLLIDSELEWVDEQLKSRQRTPGRPVQLEEQNRPLGPAKAPPAKRRPETHAHQ